MSQPLPEADIKFNKNAKLKDILNTPDDNEIGYFVEAQKRSQAVNDFEKDFYKLLNNAFYGKTMDNVRN